MLFPASAWAQPPSRGADTAKTTITARLQLPAGKGLRAELEAGAVGSQTAVTLTVTKGRRFVNYQVEGKVAQRRFEARFGQLGHVSFRFVPTKTLPNSPVRQGCPVDVTRRGHFVGSAHFVGERGYVSIDARHVKGTVTVQRGRRCAPPATPSAVVPEPPLPETALLRAFAPNPAGLRLFIANGSVDPATDRHETTFVAGLIEREGGMTIGRFGKDTSRQASRFRFDQQDGTATVRPPAPFRGSASFVRRGGPKHPGRWRGNLSLPLLGHDPIRLTGDGFLSFLGKKAPTGE